MFLIHIQSINEIWFIERWKGETIGNGATIKVCQKTKPAQEFSDFVHLKGYGHFNADAVEADNTKVTLTKRILCPEQVPLMYPDNKMNCLSQRWSLVEKVGPIGDTGLNVPAGIFYKW